MLADEGKRVTISFICRLEDGTLYDIAERDTLQFVIGQGNTLPTLELGVIGMSPGEFRVIRVPATEVEEFPFEEEEAPTEARFPAGVGYEFGPGDDGDIVPPVLSRMRPAPKKLAAGADLIFDVKLVKVENADLEFEE